MALMPGLQINIGQQLKLTPQLQQSIKILQYSAMEVQQTIETTLESNYMLEVEEDGISEDEILGETTAKDSSDQPEPSSKEDQTVDLNTNENIGDDLQIDCDWDEVYSDYSSTKTTTQTSSSDEFVAAENYTASQNSLHDHLYWQSDIFQWRDNQDIIADFLIDDISDEGYLTTPLPNLLESICLQYPDQTFTLDMLESVLSTIQQFEPTGVGARSIQESLLLQLANMAQTPYVVTAKQLISENFDWLEYHDHKRIKKMYGLNDQELNTLFKLIQSLNPRPGREFSPSDSEVIIPDLRLKRSKNGWLVELNADAFPRLKVNASYIDLASKLNDSEQNKKIKEQLVEAKGLIKSIHSRGETLLRVGTFIVERQHAFFEEGELAMQPLVLRDVAEHLDLHESTISRATNQKYIQTPRGTLELKYFFSSGVSQYGSADQSAISIKAHIKGLIEKEDPKKPLSDSKLMDLLESEKEISVARRTIAKYREALGIPSSSERKKLNKFKL
ncbi:MAG: RNA polymerase factor sigma-54 [Pseudomonadota bacterium]|nr:RNA polymerase factor sigma-54 [Pseudomonadota bacterium]